LNPRMQILRSSTFPAVHHVAGAPTLGANLVCSSLTGCLGCVCRKNLAALFETRHQHGSVFSSLACMSFLFGLWSVLLLNARPRYLAAYTGLRADNLLILLTTTHTTRQDLIQFLLTDTYWTHSCFHPGTFVCIQELGPWLEMLHFRTHAFHTCTAHDVSTKQWQAVLLLGGTTHQTHLRKRVTSQF